MKVAIWLQFITNIIVILMVAFNILVTGAVCNEFQEWNRLFQEWNRLREKFIERLGEMNNGSEENNS